MDAELTQLLSKRMAELPAVVRDAIASSEVEKHLRTLATTEKLHLDQWELLENEVMFTLLGIRPIEELEQNIASALGVSRDVAHDLANNINEIIFEPIRQELERQLEHPDAEPEPVPVQYDTDERPVDEVPPVQPATPPAATPDVKVARPSESTAYKPGEASTERKNVHDDPYRMPPV